MLEHITKDLIAFSDVLTSFATTCVYLIYTNNQTNEVYTSIVTSQFNIVGKTKFSLSLSMNPLKETHGAFLAVSLLIKIAKLMIQLDFTMNSVYLGMDALSQVAEFLTPLAHFEGQLQKYFNRIV